MIDIIVIIVIIEIKGIITPLKKENIMISIEIRDLRRILT